MQKVIAIVGSLRKGSINRIVFDNYREINAGLFEMEEGLVSDIPLYNADVDKEPESVKRLAAQIKNSSGVIFFSPEYNYSVPGVLKNAIDYLSKNESGPLNGKPASVIGASPGNLGTARMQYHLRQIGVTLNIPFLNKPEVMIGKASDKLEGRSIKDSSTNEILRKHGESFKSFIDNKK